MFCFVTLEKIIQKNLHTLDGQKILQKLRFGKKHIILHGFSTIPDGGFLAKFSEPCPQY